MGIRYKTNKTLNFIIIIFRKEKDNGNKTHLINNKFDFFLVLAVGSTEDSGSSSGSSSKSSSSKSPAKNRDACNLDGCDKTADGWQYDYSGSQGG